MTALVDLWPRLLACRHIPRVDDQLAAALGLDPRRHCSAGLLTCDQDDSMYVALDHATKYANVDVVFGRSFYAGSAHASGPFSGEVLGILAGTDPDEVAEGLWALGEHLRTAVRFQTFPGSDGKGAGQPTFLAHVIPETGRYLSPLAGIAAGEPMAYLIAPPLESVLGIDAALKAAGVRLAKHISPPSETNFGGAFLAGELPALQAARDAFVAAIASTAERPLEALRRPAYARRR